MKSKLSSNTLNLIIAIAIIVVVNYIVGGLSFLNFRADLTEKNIYTLSDGTKRIISGLSPDKPVTIRLYVTRDNRLMPQWAQAYSATVQDLLLEFEKNSGDKIKLEKIDPRPNTEEEDKAVADDIQGYTVNEQGDKAYFGLAIQCLQQKEVIASLNPNEEANLEYQVARALGKVSKTKRSVIGIMSPMPIAAPAMNFPGMPQRQPPPWVVVQQLRQDYDVREVAMSSTKIDDDVSVLILVHPAGISEQAQFAVDQFLMRGGKMVAFLDPQCLVAKAYDNPGQMGMAPTSITPPSSDMPALLKAWGIRYDQGLVTADMNYRTQAGRGRAVPTFLTVDRAGINRDEPVTSALEVVQLFSSGSFGIESKEGISYTKLIESSENSEMIDSTAAEQAQREGLKTFNPDGKKKTLALRLSGKFKSAFPDGPPKDTTPVDNAPKLPGGTGGEDKKDAGAPADKAEKKEDKPASLKESNGEAVVFLFGDADMQYDMFALESDPSGRVMPIARNSNIPMLLNTVEMLTGGKDLIDVRSRAVTKRPFTKMQEIKSAVEGKYRPLVEQKQQELQKVVDEITAIGGVKKDSKGMGVITINQAQLKELRDKQAAIQKDIREFQKEQSREKDRTEMIITALNILVVPLLLVIFGVSLAMRRHALRAAH